MPKERTFRIIFKQVGSLFILLGVIIAIPSLISAIYKEWYSAAGFIISGLIVSGIGYGLYRSFYFSNEPQNKHALIITALGWLLIAIFGGLPFFIISAITPLQVINQFIPSDAAYTTSSLLYFRNPLHCIFESMSAYTTTGLTMAIHEPSVGYGVLFYRSFAQWVGGAGFIVTVLSVFQNIPGQSALMMYGSEYNGQKLKTTVIQTTRSIWIIYVIITAFSFFYLVIGTAIILPDYPLQKNIFDSLNHAMTGQSTGGFSVLDDSIAGYNSVKMDMLYLLPMILGSLSAAFYFQLIFKRKFNCIYKDIQARSLLISYVVGSTILSLLLINAEVVTDHFRTGIFQFVSAMSTTGWQTSDIGKWDSISILFLVVTAMLVGGSAGATVGGIKMIRALLILKGLKWQVKKVFFSERTILNVKFDNRTLLQDDMNKELAKTSIFAITFLLMMFGGALITSYFTDHSAFSLADAFFESASAQGTVGLSSGITDPSMSPIVEGSYIIQMWTGRLEIIPVLALFRAIIWGIDPRIF